MVITVLADVLGKENNGTTIAASGLVSYLREQGHRVKVVCCDTSKLGLKDYYVVPIRKCGKLIDSIIAKNEVVIAKPEKRILKAAIEGSDIVHAMMPFSLGVNGTRIAKQMGIPVTAGFHVQAENFTAHVSSLKNPLINDLTYKYYNHRLYKNVDAIHYPTTFIRDEFKSHVKNDKPYYVISNGVPECFRPMDNVKRDTDKFSILCTGRFSKEKCQRLLIKAVAKSKHKDNIQLFFAGSGPRKKRCIKLAKRLKINDPIISLYPREELAVLINKMDLYCHPSYAEIEAISCLEAIKCGVVPLISNSKKSATKSFAITPKSLFKDGSVKDLAAHIDYWIEHEQERKDTSKLYLTEIKNHVFSNCMKEMENMMKEVVVKYKGNEN